MLRLVERNTILHFYSKMLFLLHLNRHFENNVACQCFGILILYLLTFKLRHNVQYNTNDKINVSMNAIVFKTSRS